MARHTLIRRLSCMTAAAETAMLLAIRILFDQHAYDRHAPRLSARLTRRCNSPEAVSDPAGLPIRRSRPAQPPARGLPKALWSIGSPSPRWPRRTLASGMK
jgi:hypothetical protein